MLNCDQSNFTCPGSLVSCECQGAITSQIWTVTSANGSSLLDQQIMFGSDSRNGSNVSDNGFSGFLSSNTGGTPSILSSKLCFNLSQNIIVNCRDNVNVMPLYVYLQEASK